MAPAALLGVDGELAQLGVHHRVAVRVAAGPVIANPHTRLRSSATSTRLRASPGLVSDCRQAAAARLLGLGPGRDRLGRHQVAVEAGPGAQLHRRDRRGVVGPGDAHGHVGAAVRPWLLMPAILSADRRLASVAGMEIRNLGSSGLKISAISYGNWLTHGSQVEEDAALACVRQALDEGITTFDTADVYADTKAESVLGKALAGERRDGLEIFTKVYWPTGPGGPTTTACRASTS